MTPARTLDEWRRWQRRRLGWPRRVRRALRRERPLELVIACSGPDPQVLAAFDSLNLSHRSALIPPLLAISGRASMAVLAPAQLAGGLPATLRQTVRSLSQSRLSAGDLPGVATLMSIGDHLPAGALARGFAEERGVPQWVVQHGLLTPLYPPMPRGSRVLTWSEPDSELIARGSEPGEVTSVGSQLLWEAAASAGPPPALAGQLPPLFLGQLHGLELDRSVTVRTVDGLVTEGPLVYRPHPAENDLLSRIQHRRWARRGIAFDTRRRPLPEVEAAVLGIFSTGLLEAAAARRQAWAVCSAPPPWVEELWSRYSLSRYGSERPTPPPPQPVREPAAAIADLVLARS